MKAGIAANVKKARATLDKIVESFKAGDIAEAVARTHFPRSDVPMDRWSFNNRLIAFFAGTQDARGFRQWEKVGRHVKKGSKAFYILAPLTYKVTDEETGKESIRIRGFKEVPVFRVEDTDGDPIDYSLPELPEFPLADVAEKFGLTVRAGFFDGFSLGFYAGSIETIEMHTEETKVFFHELAHAAHERAIGEEKFRANSYSKNEVVAETVALTLALMHGGTWERESGNSHRYIEHYSGDPIDAVLEAMKEVEATLNLIFETHANEEKLAA